MISLTMRPYAGEADLKAIASLINTCEAVEQLNEGTSVSELRQEFDTPSVDKARDLRLWEDGDGKLIGFAQLGIPELGEEIDGFLWFCVYPTARGSDLERQIVAWGEGRMREVRQERGVQVKLHSLARADKSYYIDILQAHGFTATRYFFSLTRSLSLPIAEPQFPEYFTLYQGKAEQDTDAWVEMFNQSFIDHWNHHDLTVEAANHYISDPNYRADLDLTAIAPDGTFAAFCYCHINPEDNKRKGCNEGWINLLGTRRGFRKQGLGRAMLLAGMQRLKLAGVETVRLGVDADNPNGAARLYESVGLCKLYTQIMYAKDV